MENNDNETLLEDYSRGHDEELRNEIVLKNLGLVRSCAISMRNLYLKSGDIDDIVNEGVIALMGAIETFDPTKGAKFETYASLKIRGAIIDYLREQDWVPRHIRKFARELDNANKELFNLYGRPPTNGELAEHLQITEEKLLRMMAESSSAVTLSFEELLYEDNFEENIQGSAGTEEKLLSDERRKIIAEAVDSLNFKERQVIMLYYYKNMKYSDIAKVLGVSQSRVSQIHTKATLTLKARLEPYMQEGGSDN